MVHVQENRWQVNMLPFTENGERPEPTLSASPGAILSGWMGDGGCTHRLLTAALPGDVRRRGRLRRKDEDVPRSPISVLHQIDPEGNAIPLDRLEATFREMLAEHGYVHMTDISDSFDPVTFCCRLGRAMPHHNGALIAEVRPSAGNNSIYYPGSTKAFTPHTEGYELIRLPPRYLALWCVHPATGEGGQTTLADTRPWIELLPDEESERLHKVEYDWTNPHGEGLGIASRHPILADHDGTLLMRFSCNNIVRDNDDPVATLQLRWQQSFDEQHLAISYRRNDMLVWDNWRMLHARNAFQDPRRHLRRIHIAHGPAKS